MNSAKSERTKNDERTIEERLAGVEGSLRRWKLGSLAVLVLGVGLGADQLKDRTKDDDYQPIGNFGYLKVQTIALMTTDGKIGGYLGKFPTAKDGDLPMISLCSPDMKQVTMIRTGSPVIEAVDKDGKELIND